MSSSGSSVNGSTVSTTSDLFVDARQAASGCSGVALQQMTLSLGGDLTLVVGRFDAVNGLHVTSANGNPHTLSIRAEGGTGSGKDFTFPASTAADPTIRVVLQTPGKVTIDGTSILSATIVSGNVATFGRVIVG